LIFTELAFKPDRAKKSRTEAAEHLSICDLTFYTGRMYETGQILISG
jgi:hypothetical protein